MCVMFQSAAPFLPCSGQTPIQDGLRSFYCVFVCLGCKFEIFIVWALLNYSYWNRKHCWAFQAWLGGVLAFRWLCAAVLVMSSTLSAPISLVYHLIFLFPHQYDLFLCSLLFKTRYLLHSFKHDFTLTSQYSDLSEVDRAKVLDKFRQASSRWNRLERGEVVERQDEKDEEQKSHVVVVTDACLPLVGPVESPLCACLLINYELPTKKVCFVHMLACVDSFQVDIILLQRIQCEMKRNCQIVIH